MGVFVVSRGAALAAGTEGEFARWTIRSAPARLRERGDLWSGARWQEQRLEPALARAQKAWASASAEVAAG
ncbi:MAG: hypothetical protein NVSMB21_21350 [Vulcanimicrobiaceae bacterium]